MDGIATRTLPGRFVDAVAPLAAMRPPGLTVETLGLRERALWDAYVRGHRDGTLFHLSAWMEAVQDVFAHEPHYLIARRGGRIVGVLPLFVVRSRLGGTMLVSVPYAVAGGMLRDDDAVGGVLLRAMFELAERCGAGVIDLRSERRSSCPLPYGRGSDCGDGETPLPYGRGSDCPRACARGSDGWRAVDVASHVTFKRELPGCVDDVLGWLPRKARAAGRNAESRHGLTVAFGAEHLRAVWRLYCRSMRRLGSISYPFAFFEALVERHARDVEVQVVRRGARTIGGLVSFRYGDVFLPYFAGCDERFNHMQTNNYLYLSAMRRAVETGCRVFDFGRTRIDNRGSYDFKRFHGFVPARLGYRRWIAPGVSPVNLSAGNPRYRLARRVWSRLPRGWCVRLSAVLAPHIPG